MQVRKGVIESSHIRDILKHSHINSMVIFDLDNTLIEPWGLLGSDQWFCKLMQCALNTSADQTEAIAHVIAIYNSVQQLISMRAVEPNTMDIIRILQDIGIVVIALTARGPELFNTTQQQLKKNKIDFSKQWKQHVCRLPIDNDHYSLFYQGIIFCGSQPKDKCLESLFKLYQLFPPRVAMIDDKLDNLLKVQKLIERRGGHFSGIRYSQLDEKVANFNFEESLPLLKEVYPRLFPAAKTGIDKLGLLSAKPKMEENKTANSNLGHSVKQ